MTYLLKTITAVAAVGSTKARQISRQTGLTQTIVVRIKINRCDVGLLFFVYQSAFS